MDPHVFASNATYMHAKSMFTRPLKTNYIIQLAFCHGQEHKCKLSQIWWIWSLFCTRVQWDTVFLNIKCHLLDVPFRPLLHRKPKNRCDFASKADSEVFLIVVVLSRSSTWSSVQCSKEEANLRLFDYLHFILSTLRTQRDYFEENVTVLVFT